jgi:lysophospholipase
MELKKISEAERKIDKLTTEHVLSVDDVDIRYSIQTLPKAKRRGLMVILPGFTEFIEKHRAQTAGFALLGFETLCLDWPGQGFSTRLSGGDPLLIHSPGYDLHLRAIDAVMEEAGFMKDDSPLFFFGHSMGGHLALRHSHDIALRGRRARGVMLSAPLIMIPGAPGYPFWVSRLFVQVACRLGFKQKGVPGQEEFRRSLRRFDPDNKLTRDPEGYAVQHDIFAQNPDLESAGATFGWAQATLQSCYATTMNPDWMQAYDIPVQAHLAGDEQVVDATVSEQMLALLPDAEIHTYDEARHELMLEFPEVRRTIWGRMERFIDERLGESVPHAAPMRLAANDK